jgi:tripartite-type tricarboxylate transporter receptor subunit TctC
MLAVGSAKRLPQIPEVPTTAETVPGYEAVTWFGLFTTAGTPAAVVNRYNEIVTKRLAEPKIAETLSTQGIVPRQMSPEQFGAFVAAESQKFASVIEKARIKLD